MKNYDEFAEEVFREADRRLALKRKRAAAIRQYTLALASMFAIILTGTFVLKNDTVREALERKFNAQNIITDESSVTSPPADTTDSDPESYATVTTTKTVTYPQDSINSTTATTAVRTESTTTAKKSHVTTASVSASSTTASSTYKLTENISVTTARTTSLQYVSSTVTAEKTTHTTATATKTTHTTATATKTTHTTATATKTTHTTATATKTTHTTATVTRTTYTTTSGYYTTTTERTYVTSSTFPPATTSWATETTTTASETTSQITYPVSTTTTTTAAVSQTTVVTQPLYPDIVLPAETADPSGNTTVPVNYRCAGELSADLQVGSQAGVITIESGGVQYVCDVYSLANSSLLDYAVLYMRENQKWLLYISIVT